MSRRVELSGSPLTKDEHRRSEQGALLTTGQGRTVRLTPLEARPEQVGVPLGTALARGELARPLPLGLAILPKGAQGLADVTTAGVSDDAGQVHLGRPQTDHELRACLGKTLAGRARPPGVPDA